MCGRHHFFDFVKAIRTEFEPLTARVLTIHELQVVRTQRSFVAGLRDSWKCLAKVPSQHFPLPRSRSLGFLSNRSE